MKKYTRIFIMLLMISLCFFILACANTSSKPSSNVTNNNSTNSNSVSNQNTSGKEPYKGNLYRNKENHFSIRYPDGWEQTGGRGPHTVVVFNSKDGDQINILVDNLPNDLKNVTIDQLTTQEIKSVVDANYNQMKTNFDSTAVLHDSGTTYINNKKAIWCSISATQKNLDRTLKIRYLFYIIWHNGKMYQIGGGTSPEKYDNMKKVFENVAGSLIFEDKY